MAMKTIKVAEATNTQLDWLVAKCEGGTAKPSRCFDCSYYEERQGCDEAVQYCHHPKMDFEDGSGADSWPSYCGTHARCPINNLTPERFTTNPAQMWPIIEREHISTYWNAGEDFCRARVAGLPICTTGPTSLIAAARCHIVSKLGKTVEVPEDLT